MVTTGQKSVTDTHTRNKKKKRKSKHITHKGSHQITGEETKEERNKNVLQNNQKTINKMAISTYLPIITLNVNELYALLKRHRLAEWIKKDICMIYIYIYIYFIHISYMIYV